MNHGLAVIDTTVARRPEITRQESNLCHVFCCVATAMTRLGSNLCRIFCCVWEATYVISSAVSGKQPMSCLLLRRYSDTSSGKQPVSCRLLRLGSSLCHVFCCVTTAITLVWEATYVVPSAVLCSYSNNSSGKQPM